MKRNRWGLLTFAIGLLALVVCFSFSSMAGTKDPPWVAKDWTQWTNDDCNVVKIESPWGYSSDTPYGPGDRSANGHRVGGTNLDEVTLLSALPVREAVLKQLQLGNRYNKIEPDKKQAFDQAHIRDLQPSDRVLVEIDNVSLESPPLVQETALPARQAALRLSGGELIQPIGITILTRQEYKNETQYSFPRTVDGKPLYSLSDSSFVIELGAPLVFDKKTHVVIPQRFRDSGRRYTFKIFDMVYKGKLEY